MVNIVFVTVAGLEGLESVGRLLFGGIQKFGDTAILLCMIMSLMYMHSDCTFMKQCNCEFVCVYINEYLYIQEGIFMCSVCAFMVVSVQLKLYEDLSDCVCVQVCECVQVYI